MEDTNVNSNIKLESKPDDIKTHFVDIKKVVDKQVNCLNISICPINMESMNISFDLIKQEPELDARDMAIMFIDRIISEFALIITPELTDKLEIFLKENKLR